MKKFAIEFKKHLVLLDVDTANEVYNSEQKWQSPKRMVWIMTKR